MSGKIFETYIAKNTCFSQKYGQASLLVWGRKNIKLVLDIVYFRDGDNKFSADIDFIVDDLPKFFHFIFISYCGRINLQLKLR